MKRVSLDELREEDVRHNPEIKKKVMIRKGELPHLTNFSQARFKPGQTVPPHSHTDMTEIFLVQAGTGVMEVNGQEILLEPGVSVAVENNEVHMIRSSGTTDLILLYFGLRVDPLNPTDA